MAQIATLNPPLSPMLWTSIATGKRPFKHGIHGFSEPTADGQGVQPVTNLSRNIQSALEHPQPERPAQYRDRLVAQPSRRAHQRRDGIRSFSSRARRHRKKAGGRSLAALPGHGSSTRTGRNARGAASASRGTFAGHGKFFVPKAREIDQNKDRRLGGPDADALRMRLDAFRRHLADRKRPWDFFAVYYDAIDHFCHGFMKYHPPRQAWIEESDFELYQERGLGGLSFP